MTSGKFPDDFELITAMQGAKARAEDFARHQDQVAGREAGYGNKHQHGEGRRGETDLQRELRSSTALDLLMADPAYAALYNDTMDLLARAEAATEQALTEAQAELTGAQDTLEETLESANHLPDGTAVFRDAQGNIRTEDGRIVGPEEAEAIVWKDNAPAYEDFLKRMEAVEEARKRIDELRRFQNDVLGPARDQLNDPDNPPSSDTVQAIHDNIQGGLDSAVTKKNAPDTRPENTAELASSIKLPTFSD